MNNYRNDDSDESRIDAVIDPSGADPQTEPESEDTFTPSRRIVELLLPDLEALPYLAGSLRQSVDEMDKMARFQMFAGNLGAESVFRQVSQTLHTLLASVSRAIEVGVEEAARHAMAEEKPGLRHDLTGFAGAAPIDEGGYVGPADADGDD
jgi:hypothetical protein